MDGRTFLGVLVESLFVVALIIGAHPVAGHTQQVAPIHRIAILSSTDPARPNENYVTFRERLRELGWSEGRNLAVEERYIGPDRERLAAAARELVGLRLDLILAAGGAEAPQAAATATKSIPIVFVIADDPVRLGLVKSLGHPDANVTGLSSMNAELDDKRLALLKEALPQLRRVGAMWSPVDPSGSSVMRATERAGPCSQRAAHALGDPTPRRRERGHRAREKGGRRCSDGSRHPDALSAAAPNRRARDQRTAADGVCLATIARGRRAPQLRRQHSRDVPPCG
jgi:hypothetical protein